MSTIDLPLRGVLDALAAIAIGLVGTAVLQACLINIHADVVAVEHSKGLVYPDRRLE